MKHEIVLPPLRRTAADAEAFARAVHAEQTDKSGDPYVDHLQRVATRTMAKISGLPGILNATLVSEMVQMAWLHDVIEDTSFTSDHLAAEGFSNVVITGVCHLTKDRNDSRRYADRIRGLCALAPLHVLLVKLSCR